MLFQKNYIIVSIFILLLTAAGVIFFLQTSQEPIQPVKAQTACANGAIPSSGCLCTGQVRYSGWCCSDIYFRAEHYSACPTGTFYYVSPTGNNSNPGTEALPWATINHAADVMVAGDIVLVREGIYDVGSALYRYLPVLQPANSGTQDLPIIFRSYPGETVRIVGAKGPLIGSYERDYIIWDGFIIDPTDVIIDYSCLWGVEGCIIQNCVIEGHYKATTDNNDGIRIEKTSECVIRDNIIRNVTGNSWNSAGIKLYYNDNVLVEHNDIYGNYTGIFDKDWGINNTYRRNLIHDNINFGFLLHAQGDNDSPGTRGTRFYENILYNDSRIYFSTFPPLDFADSEIYSNVLPYMQPELAPNLQIWNNIFTNGYICRAGGTPTYSDHNVFWPNQSFETGLYTSSHKVYNTLSEWQSGTGLDRERPSKHEDPLFADPANYDFHLQAGSPCIGTGKDGLDIGAYPRNDGTVIGPRTEPAGPPPATCQDNGGACKTNQCSTYENCSSLTGSCSSGYCCYGACATPPPPPACSDNGGVCYTNQCSSYDNCASLTGACQTGICCQGACTTPSGTFTEEWGQTPTTDYPNTSQDTYLNSGQAATNFSTNTYLRTYTWPQNTPANTILMKWDLSALPPTANIIEAKLYLYQLTPPDSSQGDTQYTLSVHKVINVNPTISQATWSQYSIGNNWPAGGGLNSIAPAEDTQTIDSTVNLYRFWTLTNMVSDWTSSPNSNYGLLITPDNTASSDSQRCFASSEHTSSAYRPKLIITYSTEASPSITLTKSVLVDGQPATEAYPGQEITYTITYTNSGTAEAKNVVITDTIPQGTTYVANSASQPPGGSVAFANNTLTWTIPSVSAGQSGTVSFKAQVE